MTVADPKALLRAMFGAAIGAARPSLCGPPHLHAPPKGRTVVIGAGKAAASMTAAVEEHGPGPLDRLVVARYGHGAPTNGIEVVARPQDSRLAAAEAARAVGATPVLRGNARERDAREVARVMAGILPPCAARPHPAPSPCVPLSGGETAVTIRGCDRGGRNAEFLLALAGDNDGYGFFSARGDLAMTGPALTDVDDVRAILISPE